MDMIDSTRVTLLGVVGSNTNIWVKSVCCTAFEVVVGLSLHAASFGSRSAKMKGTASDQDRCVKWFRPAVAQY